MLECILNESLSLEEVLTKKSTIKFRVNNGNTWYTTTVEKVSGDEVTLAFPEMFAAVDVVLGYTLICRFSNENCEYGFEAEIESIKIYFPQHIKLKVLGEIKRSEDERQAKREDTLFLADVFTKNETETLHSCVRDVSSTGIKLISKHNIKSGSEVGVSISLPTRNIFDSVVKLQGKVMWSKAGYTHNEYGIAITEMDEVYRDRISQFLDMYAK